MCEVRRIKLEYDETKDGHNPTSVILKFARSLPQDHWISILVSVDKTYLREINAYRFLGERSKSLIAPAHYLGISPDNTKYTLILADLQTPTGTFHQVDQFEGLDLKTAELSVRELARFHAQFTNNPEVEKNFECYSRFFSNIKSFTPQNILCQEFMDRVQALFEAELTGLAGVLGQINLAGSALEKAEIQQSVKKLNAKQLVEHHRQVLKHMLEFDKAPIRSLIHCDLRPENLFFKEGAMKIVDWKYGLIGNPLVDVMRFLTQSLKIEDRRKMFEPLLKEYIKEFESITQLKVAPEYIQESLVIYLIIELHFLASTLSFLASADLSNIKELFSDKVIETSFLMLDRALALYTDSFK